MSQRKHYQIALARSIRDVLGTKEAASFLRERGWSIEAALYILTTSGGSK